MAKANLAQAAASAQTAWASQNVDVMRFLADGSASVVRDETAVAARASSAGLVRRFPATAAPVTMWGGALTASLIGAGVWSAQIPTQHGKAATTAAAYGLVAVSAAAALAMNSRALLHDLSRFGPDARRTFLRVWPLLLTGFAAVYGVLDSRALSAATRRHAHRQFTVQGEFAAFAELTAVGMFLGLLIAAAAKADAIGRTAGGSSLTWTGRLLLGRPEHDASAARRGERPLDEPMLGLLDAAAGAARIGAGALPPDRTTVRALINDLEVAAGRAQGFASGRVPMVDFATRLEADRDGARLASLIRGFKAPLARAARPGDFTTVAKAMSEVLLAWAHPDGDGLGALLDKAPDVRRPSLWQRLRGRIGNAALLATAGLALPELPIYAHDPAAATGARYTLLTAAVFALVTGGAPAWDTVGSVLEKAGEGAGAKEGDKPAPAEGG